MNKRSFLVTRTIERIESTKKEIALFYMPSLLTFSEGFTFST